MGVSGLWSVVGLAEPKKMAMYYFMLVMSLSAIFGGTTAQDNVDCVDNALCATSTDICRQDTDLVRVLCPVKCGFCGGTSDKPAQSGVELCALNPCLNGGTCVPAGNDYSCTCPAPYIGKFCERVPTTPNPSICEGNPCLNGGTCIPQDNSFVCQCPAAFPGAYCLKQCNQDRFTGCNAAEIIFMLEYSRIDTPEDVDHEGDFIREIIDQYRVDSDHARVGVVVYHDTVKESVHITDFKDDAEGLNRRIRELTGGRRRNSSELVPSGDADIAKALDFVKDNSFVGAREGAPRVVIAILHQMPTTEDAKAAIPAAAQRLKDETCATVYGIGVYSESLNASVAHSMVSEPWNTHYFPTNTFDQLEERSKMFTLNCPTEAPPS